MSLIVFVIKRFQIKLRMIVEINGRFLASLERIRSLMNQGEVLELEIAFKRIESVSKGKLLSFVVGHGCCGYI